MNGYATKETIDALKEAFELGMEIQKMNESYKGMTNGEKLMKVFPEIEVRDEMSKSDFITFTFDHVVGNAAERKWWNAPYKRSRS